MASTFFIQFEDSLESDNLRLERAKINDGLSCGLKSFLVTARYLSSFMSNFGRSTSVISCIILTPSSSSNIILFLGKIKNAPIIIALNTEAAKKYVLPLTTNYSITKHPTLRQCRVFGDNNFTCPLFP